MQIIRVVPGTLALPGCMFAFLAPAAESAQPSPGKIRVLVVTGGHGFEQQPCFKLQ